MKERRLLTIIGDIDDRFIADAAPAAKKARRPVFVKWAAAAACLAVVLAVGIAYFRTGNTSRVLIGGIAREYGGAQILPRDEASMEWPWEYKTPAERYTSLTIDGREYASTGREVDASLTGKTVGEYDAEGYDAYTGETRRLRAEVFEVSGVSAERVVAVKLGDGFYTFTNPDAGPMGTFGEALDAYDLTNTLRFHRFAACEGLRETGYFALNDDTYIWEVLSACRDAERVEDDAWSRKDGDYLSFTATSDALGVYKRVFCVSGDGYISTNIFDVGYTFRIGGEAAEKIISYARQNGTETSYEPYTGTLAGAVTEIADGYILVDDSILCKNKSDGMIFRVPADELQILRCVEYRSIGVGDLVVVSFTGKIDPQAGNLVEGAYDLAKGTLLDGGAAVPE